MADSTLCLTSSPDSSGDLVLISSGHAFVQNRRGHYELATHVDPSHQLPMEFAELAWAI